MKNKLLTELSRLERVQKK